jgi:hypothetical protein
MEETVRKATILVAFLAALAAGAPPDPARAQMADPVQALTQLMLARICVHELTWNVDNDCEPIWQVLHSAGGRRGPLAGLRRYSPRFWAGISRRPWARALEPAHADRGAPDAWPEAWPAYGAYRAQWRHAYEQAGAIVRGEIATRCTERPDHWGSLDHRTQDYRNAQQRIARGVWVQVDCGPTIQGYYRRTRR